MDLNSLMHSPDAANTLLVVSAKDLKDCFESWMKFTMQRIKEQDEPSYYTREELLEKLHVSDPTLNNYRKKGLIPEPVTIEGRVLYDKAEVRKAIENNRRKFKKHCEL